jgi:carboxylesterase type B
MNYIFLELPSLDEYLTLSSNLSPEKILMKLIEITTDLFFNIPCTLTANLWGKFSPAFFYQFDHVGEISASGKYFYKSMPIASKRNSKELVAHGDELAYLFDVHDIFGNRINETILKSVRDQETRKNIIELVTQFSSFNSTQSQFTFQNQMLQTFIGDSSSYLRISDKSFFEKDFRFCQLSIFGAPLKATQKVSCEFVKEGLKKINIVSSANEIVSGKKIFG